MQFLRDIYRILWLNKREDYLHLCHIYILQHSVLLWTGGISILISRILSERCEELEKEAIDSYFRHLSRPKYKSTKLLEAGSPYLELMSSYFTCESQDLLHWAQAPYAHNQQYVEQCIHKTSSGNLVRSKSEAITLRMEPFRFLTLSQWEQGLEIYQRCRSKAY